MIGCSIDTFPVGTCECVVSSLFVCAIRCVSPYSCLLSPPQPPSSSSRKRQIPESRVKRWDKEGEKQCEERRTLLPEEPDPSLPQAAELQDRSSKWRRRTPTASDSINSTPPSQRTLHFWACNGGCWATMRDPRAWTVRASRRTSATCAPRPKCRTQTPKM